MPSPPEDPDRPDRPDRTDEDGEGGDGGDARRPLPPDDGRGASLIALAWAGTGVYVATAVLATATTVSAPLILVCGILFLVGLGTFTAAYLLAIGRSREDAIGMGGLYFLAGSAPRRVQRHLLGAAAVQTLTATVTASIGIAAIEGDASNPLAFGFLVPLFGLGLAGLWGARFGVFAPRPPDTPRAARATRVPPAEPTDPAEPPH